MRCDYSREYNIFRKRVDKQAQGDTEFEIEYEKILNRVKKTSESVTRMQDLHFTVPVEESQARSKTFHQVASPASNTPNDGSLFRSTAAEAGRVWFYSRPRRADPLN